MFNSEPNHINTFDITDVGHIERIVIGTTMPDQIPSESESQEKMKLINRCLTDYPKGRIIGVERSFSGVRIGEHQVILECVVYHIGFRRQPAWLEDMQKSKPAYSVDENKVNEIIGHHTNN